MFFFISGGGGAWYTGCGITLLYPPMLKGQTLSV
jgi:hypothetical protein